MVNADAFVQLIFCVGQFASGLSLGGHALCQNKEA